MCKSYILLRMIGGSRLNTHSSPEGSASLMLRTVSRFQGLHWQRSSNCESVGKMTRWLLPRTTLRGPIRRASTEQSIRAQRGVGD